MAEIVYYIRSLRDHSLSGMACVLHYVMWEWGRRIPPQVDDNIIDKTEEYRDSCTIEFEENPFENLSLPL